jgi:hypothetical protein
LGGIFPNSLEPFTKFLIGMNIRVIEEASHLEVSLAKNFYRINGTVGATDMEKNVHRHPFWEFPPERGVKVRTFNSVTYYKGFSLNVHQLPGGQ